VRGEIPTTEEVHLRTGEKRVVLVEFENPNPITQTFIVQISDPGNTTL